jgi:hypothetical protein
VTEGCFNANTGNPISKTDYAANAGDIQYQWLGTGPGTNCITSNLYPNCGFSTSNQNGVSYNQSEIKPENITDGLSQTMFAAEKYMNPNFYYTGSCCSDNNSAYEGHDWDLNRWVPTVGGHDQGATNTSSTQPKRDTIGFEDCTDRFGSAHATCFHAVFCDGSVHTLQFSIDLQVFSCLGARNDQIPHDDIY